MQQNDSTLGEAWPWQIATRLPSTDLAPSCTLGEPLEAFYKCVAINKLYMLKDSLSYHASTFS